MNELLNGGTHEMLSGAETRSVGTDIMVSRQTQEAQGMMIMAQRFPRNQVLAYNRVVEACKRPGLAEKAMYEYPRGNERVSGPSIRLAEAIAQNWGNIDYGWMELAQSHGESQVMAYAWDMETNTRQTRMFTVPHIRHTKTKDYPLTDPRDVYELVANNSARRVRACILGIVPGDVVEAAVDQCNKTLAGTAEKPLVDLVRDMADTFKTSFGITLPQIEKYIGWKAESFSMRDLVRLKGVYNSLKDGMARKEEIFDMTAGEDEGKPKDAFAIPEKPKKTEEKGKKAEQEAKQSATTGRGGRGHRKKEPEPAPEPDHKSEYEQYEAMMNKAPGEDELPWV